MRHLFMLMMALLLGSSTALSGGFMVGEMASRSAGMASAFTAVSDDASAAWHNPAGIAFSSGSQIMVGGDIILPQGKFTSNSSTKGKGGLISTSTSINKKTFFVPHTYLTYWDEDSNVGASLSINAPFGLETKWPSTADNPFASKNTFSRMNMVMVNPSMVYKVTNRFSVAAGVDYVNMYTIDLNNTAQNLHGNGDGWGGNASIFYKGDSFNLGVTYRSQIKVNIDGVATAVAGGALAKAPFGATSSPGTTSVTLPDQVNIGLAYIPNDEWTLSFDVDWVNWNTYDSIDINYASAAYRGAVGGLTVAANGGGNAAIGAAIAAKSGSTSLPQNWNATVAVRVGVEWKYNSKMRARFGYTFDPTPVDDASFSPSIPGNDKHIFSLGYGYDMSANTTIDLAYTYAYLIERNQTQSPATPVGSPNSVKNGVYNAHAHILMASINHLF